MKELDHDLCLKVAHNLVKCLSRDKSFKTFNDLRYSMYHKTSFKLDLKK